MLYREDLKVSTRDFCQLSLVVLPMVSVCVSMLINDDVSGVNSTKFQFCFAASLFFVTYEASKRLLGASVSNDRYTPFVHMAAASFGEIVCIALCFEAAVVIA